MRATEAKTPCSEAMGFSASEMGDLIGNTPLLRISLPEIPRRVYLMAKIESRNPGGSVKDRAARQIALDAVASGQLKPGKVLLDSTSGNTGVAYAMIGASMGLDVTICVPSNASPAKLSLMEALGAELIYTDPLEGSDGAQCVAQSMFDAESDKYFLADQYSNESNPKAHYLTTGPEIWNQTRGMITHLVAGIGTGGTVTGISKYLREKSREIKIIGVQPSTPLHGLEGLKHLDTSVVPPIFHEDALDDKRFIETRDANCWVERLATEKGLLVGPSSGAALAAGVELACGMDMGTIVVILPDGGERYLPLRRGGPMCPPGLRKLENKITGASRLWRDALTGY